MDETLFQWMTAGPGASPWVLLLARLAATWIVPCVALGLLLAWEMRRARAALLDAVASGLLGLGLVQVIGAIWYRPGPFEVGEGLNLLHHLPESSFPSDHATLMFALGFALVRARVLVGWPLLVLALVTGWARVYLGVHWPSDILGGAELGLGSAMIVGLTSARMGPWAWIERAHDRLIFACLDTARRARKR